MRTHSTITLLAISSVLLAVACSRTGDKAFRDRAAEDMKCPANELYIVQKWEGDSATKLAQGCGLEANYVRECQHEGCLWKMQAMGPIGQVPAAPAAADAGASPASDAAASPASDAAATD